MPMLDIARRCQNEYCDCIHGYGAGKNKLFVRVCKFWAARQALEDAGICKCAWKGAGASSK